MTGARDFDAFYRSEYARLVGELFALTGSLGEAEDVVQEAFAAAFGRWARVSELDQPAAWVRRVAMNTAVSRWRRARTHRAWSAAQRRGFDEPADPGLVDLLRELERLPRAHRRVLVLHHVVGLSVREIAQTLGHSESLVKSQLWRTRVTLRERLAVREGPR